MIRRVSAIALVLCVNTVSLYAQTAPQAMELTVKAASADVYKSPTVASAVVGKAQRGTVLEIRRNLGSWIEVPWQGADNGVAFLHVSTGTIARRTTVAPNHLAANGSLGNGSSTGVGSMPDNPAALSERILANGQTTSNGGTHNGGTYNGGNDAVLPRSFGMGARLNPLTPSFGAGFGLTSRTWWSTRLGFQVDVLHSRRGNLQGPGHVTALQFAPSMLVSLPDAVTSNVWLRPYVGGGGSLYRTTFNHPTADPALPGSEKLLGFQTFGGAETTFAAMPQFAVSAELGYRWSETSIVGFAPRKTALSLSAHWYIR
jgi:hypothetical protein